VINVAKLSKPKNLGGGGKPTLMCPLLCMYIQVFYKLWLTCWIGPENVFPSSKDVSHQNPPNSNLNIQKIKDLLGQFEAITKYMVNFSFSMAHGMDSNGKFEMICDAWN